VARTSHETGGKRAEFAILVSHYVAGMGLGRHLMGRLVRWAKAKKLERLYGDVLESNQPMLALAQSLGFTRAHGDAPGLSRVELDLTQRA
jgi:RimJ/RimL family protein N-acetyltransferase